MNWDELFWAMGYIHNFNTKLYKCFIKTILFIKPVLLRVFNCGKKVWSSIPQISTKQTITLTFTELTEHIKDHDIKQWFTQCYLVHFSNLTVLKFLTCTIFNSVSVLMTFHGKGRQCLFFCIGLWCSMPLSIIFQW